MALVLKDRVKETTTTTGTGTYTLAGAATGFEAFSEIGDGNTTYYCCTDGTDFEVGIGTYTASGTTLARTTILQSSNSDAAVNWTSGTRDIFCTQPAEKAVFLDASNIAIFSDDVTFEGASANIVFDKSADEIRFPQDTNVRFGASGSGLQIYHNSSGGQINNGNSSGNLYIVNNTDDGDIRLSTDNGSGSITTYIHCDGGTGEVKLNYYGNTKLKTTNTGILVSGEVVATDLDISGDVDVDGTLEADAITLDGVALGTIATQAADSVDIDGGAIDGVTIGTNSAVTDLRVDRLKLNLNTISNTVTNDSITLNPNGTGIVNMNTDTLRIGDLGADVTVTTTGTGDLTLSTNEGTDTGTIVIADGVNGNISLTPNGTGSVVIDGLSYPQADGNNGQVLTTDGSGTLSFTTVSGGGSVAADDITAGDAAINLTTTSGNITIDAQASDSDIIFKGTDDSSDTTFLTLDGSDAGTAIFNHDIKLGDNSEVKFGDGGDIEIYHHSSSNTNQYRHSTAGITTMFGAPTIQLMDGGMNEKYLVAKATGSYPSGVVELYFANSKKLETTSTGVKTTGTLDVNSAYTFPTSDGSNGQVLTTDGSGSLSFTTVSGGGGGSTALDDITTGDAASTLATTAGNITIDAQGSDTDIIFKGTDSSSDITALTLDMSDAGKAIFNSGATFGGAVDVNSSLSADSISVIGSAEFRESGGAILIRANSAQDRAELHYNGSEKLVTSTTGITVTGTINLNSAYTFPTSDGSANQVLQTDGSGTLSFATVSSGGSGISNVVEDTTPQLGGDLQSNGNDIDLADSDKLIAGTGGDLEFYHDGSNSYIDHVGADAQTLYIRNTTATTNSTDGVVIETKASNPHYVHVTNNGAVRLGISGSDKLSVIGGGTYFNHDIILNSSSHTFKFRNGSYYTTLSGTAATADHTITVPNATGTLALDESTGMTLNNGVIALKNGGTQSEVRLYCESSNAHYAALKAPAHADFAGNVTSTLPSVTGTLIGTANADAPATTTSSSDADHVLVNDGGVLKKITPSDLGIGSGGGGVTVQDEGSSLSTTATTLNFVGSGVVASGTGATKTITIAAGGGSASDSFKTISVSGQSDVIADSSTDTLTLVAGSNMTITTDASGDSITFASSGGGGGGGASNLNGLSDVTISSVQNNDLLKYNSTAGVWQNTNLGVTVEPSITASSTVYPGTQTATLAPSSGTYDQVAYFAEVRDSTNSTTIVSNANITKSGNTLTFVVSTTGSYILRVRAQDFGDLESEFATHSFTVQSFPSLRYMRIAGSNATSHTFVTDITLYTGIGQTGTVYPDTIGNMTSDTAPSPLVATSSGHYNSTSYYTWKAFDTSLYSGWWNLGQYSTYGDWYIQLDLGSSFSAVIQSASVRVNTSYSGGTGITQTYTLLGSSTGSFSGEEITLGSVSSMNIQTNNIN